MNIIQKNKQNGFDVGYFGMGKAFILFNLNIIIFKLYENQPLFNKLYKNFEGTK